MNNRKYVSDIAFTSIVKSVQEKKGSRKSYSRMEESIGWQNKIDANLENFISQRNSFYLATANSEGQPYIQHRGGPKGFLRVFDDKTLAFADYSGNRQYITIGTLQENLKAFIFLMNYPDRIRIKIWGTAKVIEDDKELIEEVHQNDYNAKPERVILFNVEAWDINCSQHITPRYSNDEMESPIQKLQERIDELESLLKVAKGEKNEK